MTVRARAHQLPYRTGVAQACVTSPPYLQQRRYGSHTDELGLENTLAAYVTRLADALDDVRRVLRPDGLLWLNLGDKANGSGGAGGDWTPQPGRRRGGGPGRFHDPAYPKGTWLDVPGALLAELLHRGWRLRLPIIWDKGRQAPEDLHHIGRPRWSHETIYLLAPGRGRPRFYPSMLTDTGSVWRFPPGGSGPAHLAPFPDELARRCILPSTLPGDLVIDPFAGSGTVGRVAHQLGRRYAGADLYTGHTSDPDCTAPAPQTKPVCPACGYRCGLPTRAAIGRGGRTVTWHADEPGPYGAPIPGDDHPNHDRDRLGHYWACPHCGQDTDQHNYRQRDTCPDNDAHPEDCRCHWCRYGVTWTRGVCCTRGSHTVGPLYAHLVVCRAHGTQETWQPPSAPVEEPEADREVVAS